MPTRNNKTKRTNIQPIEIKKLFISKLIRPRHQRPNFR